jgi:hypothetical protein
MKIIESILPITTSNQGMEQFFRNRKYGGEVTTATVFSRKGAEHHHLDKSGSNFMKNRNLNSKSALMPSNLNRSSSILRNSTEQRNHSRQDDEM